jgi:hypothetical protein
LAHERELLAIDYLAIAAGAARRRRRLTISTIEQRCRRPTFHFVWEDDLDDFGEQRGISGRQSRTHEELQIWKLRQ